MLWNPAILDANVAPGFSCFTQADIPDLSEAFSEAPHWLANYFLNSVLRTRFEGPLRQAALAYLRRLQHALLSYSDARVGTLAYLATSDPTSPRIRQYYAAVDSWETTVLQLSMGIDLLKWLAGGTNVFTRGEGTVVENVYQMGNHVKHIGSCLSSGQCTEGDSLPLWLSNDGLCSFGLQVTYPDLASLIREMAAMADKLQDPASFREKLAAEIAAERQLGTA
jgi:hypothetical protein